MRGGGSILYLEGVCVNEFMSDNGIGQATIQPQPIPYYRILVTIQREEDNVIRGTRQAG